MKSGETFTIAGVHPIIPNPNRAWWQFWKPRYVADRTKLTVFKAR